MTTLVQDRLQSQIENILTLMLPRVLGPKLGCYVPWLYRVLTVTPAVPGAAPVLISGVPVNLLSNPYGPLANIALYPGPTGSISIPTVGAHVLVAFAEGNTNYPYVFATDPLVPPLSVQLGGALAIEPIALAPGAIAAFGALGTFMGALQAALVDPLNTSPNLVGAALAPATGTATAAMTAAAAAVPSLITKGY
jgi:hypothetical protein